ncbi:MAG: hypothetical protein ACHREM_15690, partial [Polyangiales bacterium]
MDRRSTIVLGCLVALAPACGAALPPTPTSEATQYLTDVGARRAALEGSLVNPSNAYSQLRLAHYAGGDGEWDALPEWNPRSEPVTLAHVDSNTVMSTPLSSAAT